VGRDWGGGGGAGVACCYCCCSNPQLQSTPGTRAHTAHFLLLASSCTTTGSYHTAHCHCHCHCHDARRHTPGGAHARTATRIVSSAPHPSSLFGPILHPNCHFGSIRWSCCVRASASFGTLCTGLCYMPTNYSRAYYIYLPGCCGCFTWASSKPTAQQQSFPFLCRGKW
jgi:hypothetical protein